MDRDASASPGDRCAPDIELLLCNGLILDVFSGQFFRGDVAIAEGRIVGFGAVNAKQCVDLEGAWVIPGLVDAHVHIESSQLTPTEFARAVLPRGTTTVIADPHEIANVLGLDGIRYMLEASEDLPLRVYLMAPSCVPATPLETAGATLDAEAVAEALGWPRVLGLGEVMNVPGVLARAPDLERKLSAARGRPVDGHAPGLSGPDLWAYRRAGPRTDHECTALPEAAEKLRAGMHVLIREGTAERNLAALLPILTAASSPFVHFATDDRHPETLLEEGSIDDLVRRAMAGGAPPAAAIASASIHAARAYGLRDLGAVAPGYVADLIVLSDLSTFQIRRVYAGGQLVGDEGRCVAHLPERRARTAEHTVRVRDLDPSFRIAARPGAARVIAVVPGQVVTEELLLAPRSRDGDVVADTDRDVLKIAVVERHRATGSVGLGLVHGLGLHRGALGSTVAHDAHNVLVAGVTDDDLRAALAALAAMGGGQVVVADGRVVASHPLPIAGLMSDRNLGDIAASGAALRRAAQALGSRLADPFMTLSFLALPVIPKLRITDQGLVDVAQFAHVPLFAADDAPRGAAF